MHKRSSARRGREGGLSRKLLSAYEKNKHFGEGGGGYRFAVLTGKMTGGSATVVPNKDKLK